MIASSWLGVDSNPHHKPDRTKQKPCVPLNHELIVRQVNFFYSSCNCCPTHPVGIEILFTRLSTPYIHLPSEVTLGKDTTGTNSNEMIEATPA